MIWGNLKASEPANLCPDTIEEAALYADAGLERIGGHVAFLRHTVSPYDRCVTVLCGALQGTFLVSFEGRPSPSW